MMNNQRTLVQFRERDLRRFTDFSSRSRVGSGGFGCVFRGQFPDGMKIVVKVLKDVGEDLVDETFRAEVETVASTVHRNLVTLLGYCFEPQMKALVYEYMERGSLDKILKENPPSIGWGKLYQIAIETAMGLSYLHDGAHQQIIHHDIKPANILIDNDLSPKITDFGLAKLTSNRDVSRLNSGHGGTPGFMAPEMMVWDAKVSYKCDVYSYGMMLFHILWRSNRIEGAPMDIQVRQKSKNGQLDQLLEQLGIGVRDRKKAKTLCMVALRCVEPTPKSRPNMRDVVSMLERETVDQSSMKQPAKETNKRGKEVGSGSNYPKRTHDYTIKPQELAGNLLKSCPPGGENQVIACACPMCKGQMTSCPPPGENPSLGWAWCDGQNCNHSEMQKIPGQQNFAPYGSHFMLGPPTGHYTNQPYNLPNTGLFPGQFPGQLPPGAVYTTSTMEINGTFDPYNYAREMFEKFQNMHVHGFPQ